MMRAMACRDWQASYTPALSVTAGEPLHFGKTDPDNPGWQWAENASGLGGWLPIALIEGDHLTKNFDSRELTVTQGTPLDILDTQADWHLCGTETGDIGWLPASHVTTRP